MNTKRLSNREYDIMQILWNSGKPMLASDILKADADMNINTVQSTLRNLLSRNLVCVANIITSGKVLARTYAPVVSANEYILSELRSILPIESQRRAAFFEAYIQTCSDKELALYELEQMIQECRKNNKAAKIG